MGNRDFFSLSPRLLPLLAGSLSCTAQSHAEQTPDRREGSGKTFAVSISFKQKRMYVPHEVKYLTSTPVFRYYSESIRESSSAVELHLAKVDVAGSNPVSRLLSDPSFRVAFFMTPLMVNHLPFSSGMFTIEPSD